jgi:hypothetical protein
VLDVLRALAGLAGADLGRLVDVPELDPPVEQERVVSHLVLGQKRVWQAMDRVVLHGVNAIGLVAGTGLLRRLGGHLHVALDHGPRQAVVVVSQEVVVDVRVELLARVHLLLLLLLLAGDVHVGHDGRAVDGAAVRVHGHLHLLVLHRDAGRRKPAASERSRRRVAGLAMGALVVGALVVSVALHAAVSCRRSPVELQAGAMLRAHEVALRGVAGNESASAKCWSSGAVSMVRGRQESARTVSVEDALRWAAGGSAWQGLG